MVEIIPEVISTATLLHAISDLDKKVNRIGAAVVSKKEVEDMVRSLSELIASSLNVPGPKSFVAYRTNEEPWEVVDANDFDEIKNSWDSSGTHEFIEVQVNGEEVTFGETQTY